MLVILFRVEYHFLYALVYTHTHTHIIYTQCHIYVHTCTYILTHIQQKTSDNVFKTLQRSFRQKKNKSSSSASGSQPNKKQPQQTHQQQQQQQQAVGGQRSTASSVPAAKVGGDNHLAPPTVQKTVTATPSSGVRHSAYVALT